MNNEKKSEAINISFYINRGFNAILVLHRCRTKHTYTMWHKIQDKPYNSELNVEYRYKKLQDDINASFYFFCFRFSAKRQCEEASRTRRRRSNCSGERQTQEEAETRISEGASGAITTRQESQEQREDQANAYAIG